MCIQAVEVYRNPGSAACASGHAEPRLSTELVPAPTNQPMDATGARGALLTGRRQWQVDPLRRSLEGPDRDLFARTQHPSIVSRSVAWCCTVSFRLSLALVALVRQAATIAASLHTRHRSVVSVLLHHRHHHLHQRQLEGRQRRRRPPRRQCQRKVNSAMESVSLAPPAAQDNATREHPAGKRMHFLSPVDLATKLVLLTMILIAVVGHSEAGTCWLRRIESTGKCSQLFARNVTRESCCAAGSGAKGYSEKDITDVGLFFINAFNDGMECSSCLDTCDRARCAPNKRCVMRRNRPKCICAPTCSGGGRGPKRNNRAHRMQQVQQQQQQQQQQQHELQPHVHQQNIKVINLSESQRNRRQYFADDGRQPRPRQLRYTGPEVAGAADRDAHRRSVKKASLSEPRSPQSSQRASAKHRAQDSDKERIDKEHNLLESVTLVSSSSDKGDSSRRSTSSSTSSSSSSSSSSSTSTSKATHRPRPRPRSPQPVPVNCTASGAIPTTGCPPTSPAPASSSAYSAPETPGWTGGERMVLLQHGPANGLALNHHSGKGSGQAKGHPAETRATPKPPTTASTGRHHRKVMAAAPAANRTMVGTASHRNLSVNGRKQPSLKSTVAPFAAFGAPKLLRVPKQGGGRHNGTARGTVRVPRREPQYLDDVFFVDNYHHRRNPHHREAAMDDFLGNEIMQHSSFYNPVCGTDGKTYKTECQLKKRACRQEIASLVVAYKGHCQTSCKFVKCPDGKRCIEDQNASPHCVTCGGAECRSDRSPKSVVCGTDGITYPSICELKRQACLTGRAIPLAYRGRCIEAASCETIKCKDRQHCLTDLKTHKPRCVSCSYKCPRMKRQQGHGKPFRNGRNNPYGEQSVKLCGTNNRTYHSWCHMQKDSCNTGFYIDVQHSGSCAYGR